MITHPGLLDKSAHDVEEDSATYPCGCSVSLETPQSKELATGLGACKNLGQDLTAAHSCGYMLLNMYFLFVLSVKIFPF